MSETSTAIPADIQDLYDQYDAAERDASAIVEGLSEAEGTWRAQPGSWSVAECLDHLATANRVYLRAMEDSAARAHREGRTRRRPALPGLIGGWFARSLGSPDKIKSKAPAAIRPRPSPPLADAAAAFFASQQEVREFLRRYADIDLARVTFPNPFITGIRFSLATGLHVIGAHERRHLIQARGVREAARRAGA